MGASRERVLDSYLVASARLGDRRDFDLLVRRWHGKLLAHAWRLLRDREAARDAVQEGWAEMLRGLPGLRDETAFPAWAYRIVSRRCARHIKQMQGDRRLTAEVTADAEAQARTEPLPVGEAAMRRAIRALPPEQQAAIALFYLEE